MHLDEGAPIGDPAPRGPVGAVPVALRRRPVAVLPHSGPVTADAFLDDRSLVSGEADGVAHVWAVPGPELTGYADSVFALDWSADGRVLVVGPGSKDGTVSLWRVDDAVAARLGPPIADPPGEPGFSGSAALTPDGATLAVGRTDGSVRLWDVAHPHIPRAGPVLTGPTNYVFAATFSPDGRLLAAASADRKTYLWDLSRPGAPVGILDGPASYAYSPAFSPDGSTLAVGSADKTVRLWDVRRPDRPTALGGPLTGPTNYVYTVAFSPDGTQLAAASTDGTAWLWDVSTPASPRARSVSSRRRTRCSPWRSARTAAPSRPAPIEPFTRGPSTRDGRRMPCAPSREHR